MTAVCPPRALYRDVDIRDKGCPDFSGFNVAATPRLIERSLNFIDAGVLVTAA
ncbi:hypothetical protein I8752_29770 [Nostocaceae cyanobacterium CENA369]|uniref:Uncharacterized protein n=1 Tax=Dendronalium phyllosphericum CENA369 TaxID=1725256 RepID=A0A8J7I6P1_9NOST|nr:hypothetical protein [Dendronalium phyllosphericum]MBH8577095.1 hypothetical protein [Dendronalium phyllosphericum CENA369]